MKRIYFFLMACLIGGALSQATAQVYVASSGGTSTTATYSTLSAAFAAINGGTIHTGTIDIRINSDVTETVIARLTNGGGNYSSILIRPADSATVMKTISSSTSGVTLLKLTGSANNVTIDGRANGTGSTSLLKFSHTNVNTSSHVVQLDSGANNNTVRWATLQSAGSLNSTACVVMNTTSGTAVSNNAFVSNTLSGGAFGILIATSTIQTTKTTISKNSISDFNSTGIQLTSGIKRLIIDSNQIFHSGSFTSNVATTLVQGIDYGSAISADSTDITRNHVYGIKANNAVSSIYGIRVFNSTATATIRLINVYNNFISLQETNSNVAAIMGFRWTGTGNLTVNFDHNTVKIGGVLSSSLGNPNSVNNLCLIKANSSTSSIFRCRNNIMLNMRYGGRDSAHMAAAWFNTPTTGTNTINNNLYYNVDSSYGVQRGVAWLSSIHNASTFSTGYQPTASPQETQSVFTSSVFFSSTNDLHLTGASIQDPNLIGTALSSTVPGDIDNQTRSTTFPYKGADESTAFLSNDATVLNVYSMGRNATPYGDPHIVAARVKNVGVSTINNLVVYLQSSGANSFLDSVTISSLAAQTATNIDFPAHNFTNLGNNTLSVYVQSDDLNSNNTLNANMTTTANSFNYGDFTLAPNGGVGFTGGTGDFVAKFKNNDTDALVNQISVYFNTGNDSVQIGIWAQDTATKRPGALLWSSATFKAPAGPVLQVISVPNIDVGGTFFCGVKQIKTTNIGFAFQAENPIRDSNFYFTSPTGNTSWTDFNTTSSPFKFMIEPRLKLQNDVGMTTLVNPTGCIDGQNQQVKMRLTNLGSDTVKFAVNNVTIKSWAILPNNSQNNFSDVTISSGMLLPDSSMDVTITNNFDMSTGGLYKFRSFSQYALDPNDINDTMPLTNFTVIASNALPQAQDFNAGLFTPTGWSFAGGMAVTAAIGNGASNGLRGVLSTASLATTANLPKFGPLTATSELTFEYKCTNTSGGAATTLRSMDTIKIQASTDCGNTWTTVGSIDTGNHTPTTNFTTKTVSLAAYAGQKVMMRIAGTTVNTTTNNFNVDLDNFNCYNPTPMTFVSQTYEQPDLTNVAVGTSNAILGRIKITTAGTASPLNCSSLMFATSGSTAPASDVSGAKVYYTGSSNVFSNSTQFGSTVNNPSGSFSFTPGSPQTLGTGINYFWIVYDIASGAAIGNKVDAVSNGAVISGGTHASSPSTVAGNREISYCLPTHTNTCGTAFFNGVRINTLNNANSGCGNNAGNAWTNYYNSGGTTTTTLRGGNSYSLTVKNDQVASIVSVWIDWNKNKTYEASEWTQVSTNLLGNDSATVTITVPNTVTAGVTGMRIRSRQTGQANGSGDACSSFTTGETEDYKVTLSPGCTWTGAVDSAWHNPANWASNSIPTSIDNVYIPLTTNKPSFTGGAHCNNFRSDSGVFVHVRSGGTLNIWGTWMPDSVNIFPNGLFTDGASNGKIVLKQANSLRNLLSSTLSITLEGTTGVYTVPLLSAVAGKDVILNSGVQLVLDSAEYLGVGANLTNNATISGTGVVAIGSNTISPTIYGTGSMPNLTTSGSLKVRVYNSQTVNMVLNAATEITLWNNASLTVGNNASPLGLLMNGPITSSAASSTFSLLGNASSAPCSLNVNTAGNLTINRPNGVNCTAPLTVGGTLTVSAGRLNMNGNNATLGKTTTATIGVVTTGSGRITNDYANTGVLSLLGNVSAAAISGLKLDSMVSITQNLPAGSQLGGSFFAKGLINLTKGDVDLNSYVVTLGSAANLSEQAGQNFAGSTGYLTTTRNLASALGSTNVAGLGPKLTTNQAPGNTTIIRGHSIQTNGGNQSIKRYFTFQPTNYSGMVAALELVYDSTELNGANRGYLRLNQSDNGGSNWNTHAGGTRTTAATATGFVQHGGLTIAASGSMFTASDSVNSPLSPVVNLVSEPLTVDGVYPNPFSTVLNISFESAGGNATLMLTDMQGKVLGTQRLATAEGKNTVQMSNLETLCKGMYLLTVQAGSQVHTAKVVKE